MTDQQQTLSQLAIDGGPKAFAGMRGKHRNKVGVEEFFALAERFGFKPDALRKLQAILSDDDLEGHGPVLSRYITTFPKPSAAERYEAMAREFFGVPHALAVSSGTGALHGAMTAIGAGPGKEVIVPAIGFVATAMSAALCGATPVFCDVNESLQMDPDKIEARITPNTIGIAPTHTMGMVADMDPIMEIARRHRLKVIEDCAQSPGALYKGKRVGTIGDFGCFSISAYKIIGGGEGGMIIARDQRMFECASQMVEGGGLWRPDRCAPPRYEGELFPGGNYRASELESTINIVQLGKLDGIVKRTNAVWKRILTQLIPVREIRPRTINDHEGEIGYQINLFPQTHELGEKVVTALKGEGVSAFKRARTGSPDNHFCGDMYALKSAFKPHSGEDRCPVAADLFRRGVIISVNQWWNERDCDDVAGAINKVLEAYCTPDNNAKAWW